MFDLTRAIHSSTTDSRQSLEDLYRNQNAISFKRGQFIPMECGKISIVYRGLVQLHTLNPSGDERVLGLAHPSIPFGLPLTQIQAYEAIALSEVLLVQLDQKEIDESPLIAQSLYRGLMRRLQQTEMLLAVAGERRVDNRLRSLLMFLSREIGEVSEQWIRLNVRLTHQQISEMIGSSRVSVTRFLLEFRKAGFLDVDATRHLVISPQSQQ